MKNKDLLIMSYLRKNARESLTSLSKKTHIPVSTIFDRLKTDADKLIKKHTCLIDFSRLGFSTRAHFAIKVEKKRREELREHLLRHQSVNTIYKINNGYDFLVEGVFRDLRDAEEFSEELDTFKAKKDIYYIIEDIAREKFLSTPEIAEGIVGR